MHVCRAAKHAELLLGHAGLQQLCLSSRDSEWEKLILAEGSDVWGLGLVGFKVVKMIRYIAVFSRGNGPRGDKTRGLLLLLQELWVLLLR